MLKIKVHRTARRFVDRLPPKHRQQVKRKILELSDDPEPPDARPLKGVAAELWRADVGEYRIIFDVDGQTLRIVLVGKRNDVEVYRRLKRQLRAFERLARPEAWTFPLPSATGQPKAADGAVGEA
jgi:mRNA interferase RelE/StbE